MMRLVKYCANGNDFLLYNAFADTPKADYRQYAQKWCARHSGIGADGFVVLTPSQKEHIAYEWIFLNADGSIAEMCGNASRCVGSFAYVEGIAPKEHTFLSLAGEIGIVVDSQNPLLVESMLGEYTFIQQVQESSLWGEKWYLLDTGVPHLVCLTDTQSHIPESNSPHNALLRGLRQKYNANVNIAYIQDRKHIVYATYERGVEDITLACGTGAAAVMALAYRFGLVDSQTTITPPSKELLEVRIDSRNVVYLKGAVQRIAVCEVEV